MDVADVDELFALPQEEFTAARDALARWLRADGAGDEARAVAKLRRPTVPAWAVNQVVRSERKAVEELLAAGAAVGKAQRRALSGVRDTGLRAAAARRRELIRQLADAAERLLAEAGRDPAAHRQDVVATLEAGSASPEAADELRAGRLSRPLEPAGFEGLAGLALVADAASPAGGQADSEAEAEDDGLEGAEAARRLAELRAALADARQRAEQAAAALAAARRRAAEEEREADARRTEADRLGREAERADRRADEARRSAAAAAEAVADAEHTTRRRQRELEAAGAALVAAEDSRLA